MHHIVICGLSGFILFLLIISQTVRLKKKLLSINCVFWYAVQLLSEIFLILGRTEWDMINIVYSLVVKYPLFLSGFNETWTLSRNFRKILKYKFHKNPFSGNRVVPYGQTDGMTDVHDKTSRRFLQSYESAVIIMLRVSLPFVM
jgi:hypothetical protein